MNDNKFNKAFYSINTSLLPWGFCVNDAADWSSYGLSCDRTQANWTNSYNNGSAIGTASQKAKSNGKPSFKSDAKVTAENMAWKNPATGNPLKTENYTRPNDKWGQITGTPNKWSISRPDTEEAKGSYEGEIQRKNCCYSSSLYFKYSNG